MAPKKEITPAVKRASPMFAVYLSPAEKRAVKKAASLTNETLSGFIRRVALDAAASVSADIPAVQPPKKEQP